MKGGKFAAPPGRDKALRLLGVCVAPSALHTHSSRPQPCARASLELGWLVRPLWGSELWPPRIAQKKNNPSCARVQAADKRAAARSGVHFSALVAGVVPVAKW